MASTGRGRVCGVLLLVFLGAIGTVAQESAPAPEIAPVAEAPERDDASEKHWYVGFGMSNYYPRLHESESKINRQLNRTFGWLPDWERPTTFADWRNRSMLWDMTVGVGRDLSPRTTLMFWTGGIYGIIKNKERYRVWNTDIRFSRASFFLSPELFYYPAGKVDYDALAEKRGCDRVRAAIANAKPYLAAATGYSFVRAEAEARFKLPLLGTVLRQTEQYDHHMAFISPRAGVEMPISENSSFSAVAIYFFFSDHAREYNGPCISFNYRYRF